MKRTVMRCRANYSGQAWPAQAIEAVLPRGSLRRCFRAPISILRHHDNSLETAPHTRGIPHAHHFGCFRSSPKIEPAIDTHSRRHTPSV